MSNPASCPVCGEAQEVTWTGERTGAAGAATVTFARIPLRACASGHAPSVAGDLAGEVTDALQSTALVARRGLPWRDERCASCGTGLHLPPRQTLRSVRVVIEGVGEVTATFRLPMIRCPRCAREQLPRTVGRRDVPAAVADALGQATGAAPHPRPEP